MFSSNCCKRWIFGIRLPFVCSEIEIVIGKIRRLFKRRRNRWWNRMLCASSSELAVWLCAFCVANILISCNCNSIEATVSESHAITSWLLRLPTELHRTRCEARFNCNRQRCYTFRVVYCVRLRRFYHKCLLNNELIFSAMRLDSFVNRMRCWACKESFFSCPFERVAHCASSCSDSNSDKNQVYVDGKHKTLAVCSIKWNSKRETSWKSIKQ